MRGGCGFLAGISMGLLLLIVIALIAVAAVAVYLLTHGLDVNVGLGP